MTFIFKLPTLTAALVFAGATFATCPSLTDIKTAGIAEATELLPGVYLAINSSDYNTNDTWIFGFAPVLVDSPDDAIAHTNSLLHSMNTEAVEKIGAYQSTMCWYATGQPDVLALAVTFDNLNQVFSPIISERLRQTVHHK